MSRYMRPVPAKRIACMGLSLILSFSALTVVQGSLTGTLAYASSSTKAKIKSKEAEAAQVRKQLEDLGAQADETNDLIYELERNLEETKQQIKELQEEQRLTQAELNDTQQRLSERIAAHYIAGQSSLLTVLIGADNFEDFVSRVQYMQAMSDSESRMIIKSKELKLKLAELSQALKQRKEEEESLIEQNKQRAAELDSYMQEAQKILSGIDSELQALIEKQRQEEEAAMRAAYEAKLKAAQAQLSNAKTKLSAAQEAERKAAQEAAADPQNKEKQAALKRAQEARKNAQGAITTATHERASVLDVARGYIGTPYAGVEGGLDCSGLVSSVYRQKGVQLPRSSAAQWAAAQSQGWSVSLNALSPGDLVFYRRKGSDKIGHVAIYAGNGKVVQAYHPGRNADEGNMNMSNWDIVGAGRPPMK